MIFSSNRTKSISGAMGFDSPDALNFRLGKKIQFFWLSPAKSLTQKTQHWLID